MERATTENTNTNPFYEESVDFLARLRSIFANKKTRTSNQIKIAKKLDRYWEAVKEVQKGKDAKGGILDDQDKLNKLLLPVIKINELCLFNDPLPFVNEAINLENELDLKNLKYDYSNYFIEVNHKGYIPPFDNRIYLSKKHPLYTSDYPVSLNSIHEKWLPGLTMKTMKSKDLLDQILVCLTIKKAKNPNKPYSEELKKQSNIKERYTSEHHLDNEEDPFRKLKEDAASYLWLILRGFTPESIMRGLITGDFDDFRNPSAQDKNPSAYKLFTLYYFPVRAKAVEWFKYDNLLVYNLADDFGALAIPLWVQKYYIYYFSDYIPTVINQILSKYPSPRKAFAIKLIETSALFNPYMPIIEKTRYQKKKQVHQFNKFSYIPKKMGPRSNFTTWLYGRRVLKNLLGEKYYASRRTETFTDIVTNANASNEQLDVDELSIDVFDNNALWVDELVIRKEAIIDLQGRLSRLGLPEDEVYIYRGWEPDSVKIKDGLSKLDISERDSEIYLQSLLTNQTQSQLAEKFKLSRGQIIRICHKVSETMPKLNYLTFDFLTETSWGQKQLDIRTSMTEMEDDILD